MAVVPDAVPLVAARHVHVGDRLDGQFVERAGRVLAPVDVVGVQIGHVDQQPHPGAVDEVVQELALGHLLTGPGEQRRDVLHRERHREGGLGGPHVRAQHVQRVPGARHGQQMAGLQHGGAGAGAARADERDVLGDQGEPSASARSARAVSRASSGRSAPPRPNETPCGTTVTPRSRNRSSDSGRWPGQRFSATASTQSMPGIRSTASAISGRQPIPVPRRSIAGPLLP